MGQVPHLSGVSWIDLCTYCEYPWSIIIGLLGASSKQKMKTEVTLRCWIEIQTQKSASILVKPKWVQWEELMNYPQVDNPRRSLWTCHELIIEIEASLVTELSMPLLELSLLSSFFVFTPALLRTPKNIPCPVLSLKLFIWH